jgi:hypothetical protein
MQCRTRHSANRVLDNCAADKCEPEFAEDYALVLAAMRGDDAAWREISRIINRLSDRRGVEAEELISLLFVSNSLRTFAGRGPIAAWLRVFVRRVRKMAGVITLPPRLLEEVESPTQTTEDWFLDREAEYIVRWGMMRLSQTQCRLLLKRFWCEKSLRAIATEEGWKWHPVVGRAIKKSLANLRNEIRNAGNGKRIGVVRTVELRAHAECASICSQDVCWMDRFSVERACDAAIAEEGFESPARS